MVRQTAAGGKAQDKPTTASSASRKYSTRFASRRGPGIGALPAELVLIIFRMIYDCIINRSQRALPPKYEVDVRHPAAFPYNVAGTCTTWLALSATVPDFWRRIVIFVGPGATPVSTAILYFLASRELEVDITIARRQGDVSETDAGERGRVAQITGALLPHLHRIKSLEYDVAHASSLPSIGVDLRGKAPLLTTLHLRSCKRDIPRKRKMTIPRSDEFQCPQLKCLIIDGYNYHNAREFFSSWVASDAVTSKEVRFVNAEPRPDGVELRAYSLLKRLSGFESIHFDNIRFDDTDDATADEGNEAQLTLALDDIRLWNLDAEAFRSILDAVDWEQTNCSYALISNCIIPRLFTQFPDADELILMNLPRGQDPLRLLQDWTGTDLCIDNCQEFNDEALRLMSSGGAGDANWPCPHMSELAIYNCPQINPEVLQRMIVRRIEASKRITPDYELTDDGDDRPFREVFQLVVSGCGTISEQLYHWFSWKLLFRWSK